MITRFGPAEAPAMNFLPAALISSMRDVEYTTICRNPAIAIP
jgi:hypothetical protein